MPTQDSKFFANICTLKVSVASVLEINGIPRGEIKNPFSSTPPESLATNTEAEEGSDTSADFLATGINGISRSPFRGPGSVTSC